MGPLDVPIAHPDHGAFQGAVQAADLLDEVHLGVGDRIVVSSVDQDLLSPRQANQRTAQKPLHDHLASHLQEGQIQAVQHRVSTQGGAGAVRVVGGREEAGPVTQPVDQPELQGLVIGTFLQGSQVGVQHPQGPELDIQLVFGVALPAGRPKVLRIASEVVNVEGQHPKPQPGVAGLGRGRQAGVVGLQGLQGLDGGSAHSVPLPLALCLIGSGRNGRAIRRTSSGADAFLFMGSKLQSAIETALPPSLGGEAASVNP